MAMARSWSAICTSRCLAMASVSAVRSLDLLLLHGELAAMWAPSAPQSGRAST
jgi:hypothetical protein